MTRYTVPLSLILLITTWSCSDNTSQKDELSSKDTLELKDSEVFVAEYKTEGDSVVIPPFEIEVELTVRANTRVMVGKEAIQVSVSLFSIPPDSTSQEEKADILKHVVTLRDTRIAPFENLKLSKSKYDSLADKDISLLINVYAGSKDSPENLLECGTLSGRMSTFYDRRTTVKCHLIEE